MRWVERRDYDRALVIALCTVVGEDRLPRPPQDVGVKYARRWGWMLNESEDGNGLHVVSAITPRGRVEIAELSTGDILELSGALKKYAEERGA